MYPNYNPNIKAYHGNHPMLRTSDDGRSLLLPFLVGAAVAFPIGYIASNTNKNQSPYQQYPYYQQQAPYYPQSMPYYQQSYYYPTYY